GGREVFVLVFFGLGTRASRRFARIPRIQRGFAARACFDLLPRQIRKRLRDANALHNRVSYIDIELECYRELIVHQASGDKYALRIAKIQVSMTNSVVA